MPIQWQNWSGSVNATPETIRYPTTQQEIINLVNECRTRGARIRVVGAGHSFTPLVQTDGVMVSLEHYQGVEHVDAAKQQVTVRAGTTIKALGELLLARGLAQENLGDIDVQAIAGAISTGTHGTGARLGSIPTQVAALTLVTPSGEAVTCSETQNRDLFKAAQVSLGSLGIISAVTLQCVPAFRLHYIWRKSTLSDCLANLKTLKAENRNFEFFWLPYTNTVLLKSMNLTDASARPKNLFRRFNELVIENGFFWLISRFNRRFPSLSRRVTRVMAALITNGQDVNYGHKIFATSRLVRFQEMEYNIPAEHFIPAMHEIEAHIRERQFHVHFPLECRFGRADDIWLSPAYKRDSAYIAVHMYKGMPYREYFEAIEAIFRKYEGRPHWGKLHTQDAASLRRLYPMWDDFQAVRARIDPDGMFLNGYLRALFGLDKP